MATTLLMTAIAMIAGLALTRVIKLIRLPNVTGFLIAGLLIGPYCFRLLSQEAVGSLRLITAVALGFIAFSIGTEFKLDHIKAIGNKVILITVFQAMGAVVLVDVVLCLCGFDVPMSLALGAIATATAPAATLMVVRQYKAKGELTRTLLPVVALDDALGLMVFSVSIAIADMIASGTAFSLKGTILLPVAEIVLSLVIGGIIGFAVALSNRFFRSRENRLMISIAAVIAGVAVARIFELSDLLLCMSIGTVYANLRNDAAATFERVDQWTPALFMLFFVLSGAELDVTALPSVGLIGIIYLFTRSLGKYFGAYIGSVFVKAAPNVRKYLGLTLLPQAGVAIGMAQIALTKLPQYGTRIQAVVLCATLIYELFGPVVTKIALTKAGEIEPEPPKSLYKTKAA